MPKVVDITTFLELRKNHPVIDVRSPGEFEIGHIPNAHSLPLMDNVERAIVGTVYKQNGKQPAILKGLDFAGPKLREYIKAVKRITKENTILVHCWRGGMRSGFLAWLFEFYGYEVVLLKGGYKAYRKAVREQFSLQRKIQLLGGMTGSGKTKILYELEKRGEQVVDLEKIARHKGSSYGSIGQQVQLSQEMFENVLADELQNKNPNERLWLEDESRLIGVNAIPQELWNQTELSNVVVLEIPFEERLNYIASEYGKEDKAKLIEATQRIEKRIGLEQCNKAIAALKGEEFHLGFSFSLKYYDKSYLHNLNRRPLENRKILVHDKVDPSAIAERLVREIKK